MKPILILVIFSILISCRQSTSQTDTQVNQLMDKYQQFDSSNHLQPTIDKTRFDTTHGWDFGWMLLEPINIATDQENFEMELSKRLSIGQKALYFIWYLDAEVTNGGFIQFYWNGYGKYVSAIKDGLRLIGDGNIIDIVENADQSHRSHIDKFQEQRRQDDWSPLYESLKEFETFDQTYYKGRDSMMALIEKYARLHPTEFAKLQ